jgi:pilus assembly protein CpaE
MPTNPILVCAPAGDLRSQLESQLRGLGYAITAVPTPADAVAALRDASFDLLVADGLAVSGAIAGLRAAGGGQLPVLIVTGAADVEARIAFLEAGADEVISESHVRRELEGRVQALLIRSGHLRLPSEGPPTGQIVAFFSPKGGVGTTTLAVNTAVLLAGGQAGMAATRVLLVDLDLQSGQVATHLNLTPNFDIGALCADEQALADVEQAASYLTRHASGIAVLAAPTRPDVDFRIGLEQLERAITLLRPRFDYVVVDAGSRIDDRVLWIFGQAQSVVVVIYPEIAALRAVSLLLTYLGETADLGARVVFAVNHLFPKELLKARDIEGLLRARPVAEIPFADVDVVRSVNEGTPVVSARPTSPAALAIGRLARAVAGLDASPAPAAQPAPAARQSLFRRRT